MIDETIAWVAWLYVATNSIRVLSYAPQIRAVWKAEDGAQAVSIATWGFWTFAHITAAVHTRFPEKMAQNAPSCTTSQP